MADNAVPLNDTRESCSLQFAVTFLAPRIAIMMHAFDAPSRAEKNVRNARAQRQTLEEHGGRGGAKGDTARGDTRGMAGVFVCCSLCALVRFHSFELSASAALFYGDRRGYTGGALPREKGVARARVERRTGRARHCLTKLRGIKFAFYCARFLNAGPRLLSQPHCRR